MIINELGLIQVYTGNGKGKTTATLGLTFRALGHGFKVHIIQFTKGSTYAGELKAAERFFPQLIIEQFGRGCPYSALIRQGMRKCTGCGECFLKDKKQAGEEDFRLAKMALQRAEEVTESKEVDILILDEIGNALRYNLITSEELIQFLTGKPAKLEVILTGRGIPNEILELADLVTELKPVKHPYQKGISSRRGIEY